jgi:hypothetical protein
MGFAQACPVAGCHAAVRRGARILVLAAAASVLGLVAAPSPAKAATVVTNAGACLDDEYLSTANGTAAVVYQFNGGFAQQWTFSGFQLQPVIGTNNSTTARCLDLLNGGTANGTKAVINACNGSASQEWVFEQTVVINIPSGKCLDVGKGANLTQATLQPCSGSAGQLWNIR